jgi:hypothetical protein
MTRYAEGTTVPVTQSQIELEKTLERYGATGFMRGWDKQNALVLFEYEGKRIRFILPLPDRAEFNTTPTGKPRTSKSAQDAYEQACRQRWRALNLVVKAKLEAIESGISSFESEFLAFIMLPNGQTVGQWVQPRLSAAAGTGNMPPLLPLPNAPAEGEPR